MNNKRIKIFLATGGSGGHINPTISVATKLTQNGYNICIISDKVYDEKYSFCNLNYRIINTGKSLKSFIDIKNIIIGFFQALKLFIQEKPNMVIGFGGYSSFPTILASVITRTPFFLHEQNVYVGKVNKIFARWCVKFMSSYYEVYGLRFNDMDKVVYTGSPVREDFLKLYNNEYKYPDEDEKFEVLITGGSAGAKIFSEYLPKIFDIKHKEEQEKLKIYHQVRQEYVDEIKTHYRILRIDAEVSPFFSNISELLGKVHLVIGRAGSSTLIELAVSGRPSILVPLSSRGNNRQIDNAKTFAKNKAGIVIIEENFNIKDFQMLFFNLIKKKDLLKEMSKNAKKLAVLDANDNILKVIEENYGK